MRVEEQKDLLRTRRHEALLSKTGDSTPKDEHSIDASIAGHPGSDCLEMTRAVAAAGNGTAVVRRTQTVRWTFAITGADAGL